MSKFNDAFWKWFGDSKVVDAKGEPLVVYHGTNKEFVSFDLEKSKAGHVWFTADSAAAKVYAGYFGVVMPLYVSMQNPLLCAFSDDCSVPSNT